MGRRDRTLHRAEIIGHSTRRLIENERQASSNWPGSSEDKGPFQERSRDWFPIFLNFQSYF